MAHVDEFAVKIIGKEGRKDEEKKRIRRAAGRCSEHTVT
jgi:hypothetical protein